VLVHRTVANNDDDDDDDDDDDNTSTFPITFEFKNSQVKGYFSQHRIFIKNAMTYQGYMFRCFVKPMIRPNKYLQEV
jgi:hypothetical protein